MIDVLDADLSNPSHASALLALMDVYARDPMGGGQGLVVAAGFRRQGVGRRLLLRAEAIARRVGCCKLTLEVLEGNRAAQAAYRGVGFQPYQLKPAMGRAQFWEKPLPDGD